MDKQAESIPFDDYQLLAYLDNKVDADTFAQIKHSPASLKRAKALAKETQFLAQQLFRRTCPSSNTLGDYVLNILDAKVVSTVDTHLRDCPHCTYELIQHQSFIGAAIEPLPSTSSRLKIFFANLLTPLQEGIAPTFAVRGGQNTTKIFQSAEHQISLTVQPDSKEQSTMAILGFVIGELASTTEIHLWHNSLLVSTIIADELGSFRIGELRSGIYEIIIRNKHFAIHIEKFQV